MRNQGKATSVNHTICQQIKSVSYRLRSSGFALAICKRIETNDPTIVRGAHLVTIIFQRPAASKKHGERKLFNQITLSLTAVAGRQKTLFEENSFSDRLSSRIARVVVRRNLSRKSRRK